MIATTRGALIRDELTEDVLGDPVATPVEVALPGFSDGFPLGLTERESREFDETSNAWRSVTFFVGRVPATVPVKEGDRIKDLRDGRLYNVDRVHRTPRSISGRSSASLRLKRTGS